MEANDGVWDEVSDALSGDLFSDRNERLRQKQPEGPPPDYLFQQAMQNMASPVSNPSAGPPLPASGLPEGWSMEQWEHYGQQWLDSQG